MSEEERDELIFACSMRTHYSEEYLERLSDEELIAVYNNSMNAN